MDITELAMIKKMAGGGSGGGSGAMVVHFALDASGSLTADKTVEEVNTAMLTTVVIGVASTVSGISIPLGPCMTLVSDNNIIGFSPAIISGQLDYVIYSSGDVWIFRGGE